MKCTTMGSESWTVDRIFERSMPVPECGCWLWMGAWRGRLRYGSVKIGGQIEMAHRLSWKVHCGSIPDGMKVLHKCDTPACVNPDHLFLGTQSANMLDMFKKGRASNSNRGNLFPAFLNGAQQ